MTQVLMLVSAAICAACALHPLAGVRFAQDPGKRRLTVISAGMARIGSTLPALVMPAAMLESALVGAVPSVWWVLALVVSSLLLAWQARLGIGVPCSPAAALSMVHRNLLPLACAWLLASGAHGGHQLASGGGGEAPAHHSAAPELWLAVLPALLVLASVACLFGQLRSGPSKSRSGMPLAETAAGTFMLGVMAFA